MGDCWLRSGDERIWYACTVIHDGLVSLVPLTAARKGVRSSWVFHDAMSFRGLLLRKHFISASLWREFQKHKLIKRMLCTQGKELETTLESLRVEAKACAHWSLSR